MGLIHSPRTVTDSIVWYLDASNIKSYSGSGSVWYDLSRNKINATKAGSQSPTYPEFNTSDGLGYFTFSGGVLGDNYSRFNISSPLMSQMTALAWYRPTITNGHVFRMSNSDYQIGPDGWTAGANYNDVNISQNSNGPVNTANLNIWNFAAITWNNQTLKGYLNDTIQGEVTRSTPIDIQSGTLRIGARSDAYAAHFVGDISIVQLYNRALTDSEIKQNFNALRGRFGL